jgi:hypothetical protein
MFKRAHAQIISFNDMDNFDDLESQNDEAICFLDELFMYGSNGQEDG